ALALRSIVAPPVNLPPRADNLTVNTIQNIPVSFTLPAFDADNDTLTYAILSGPSNGSLSGTAPNLTYTPANNFIGTDTLTWQVTDTALATSQATVTINVSPANPPPVAADVSYTLASNTATPIALVANDTNYDPLTY